MKWTREVTQMSSDNTKSGDEGAHQKLRIFSAHLVNSNSIYPAVARRGFENKFGKY